MLALLVGNLVSLAFFLALLAGGLWVWRDYRRDFHGTKALIQTVSERLGRRISVSDRLALAEAALSEYARTVNGVREAASKLSADIEVNMRRAGEEDAQAVRAAELIKQGLQRNNPRAAEIAASVKINSEQRALGLRAVADEQRIALQTLTEQLEEAMLSFDAVRAKVDTIAVFQSITEARQRTYALVSAITGGGFSPSASLDQLLDRAERDMVASGKMLEFARGTPGKESLFILEARTKAQDEVKRIEDSLALTDGAKT